MTQRNRFQTVCGVGHAAVAAVLCALMAAPQGLLAEEMGKTAIPVKVHVGALTSQEKTLHALNRLTFGPRPGDEAAVSKMGLEAWFQAQLRPETIDDSALEAKLDMFPAMRLSQAELLQRFPSPQRLKGMQRRGDVLPTDPVEHAIYADAMASYDDFQKKMASGVAADGAAGGNAMQTGKTADAGGDMMAGGDMAMAPKSPAAAQALGKKAKMKEVVATDQDDLEAIEAMTPDQRMQVLVKMSPEEMLSLRKALRGPAAAGALMRGLTPAQMETVAAMQAPGRLVAAEALESRLVRDVASQRQLQAVMTDFWLNHFSVYVKKNQNEAYFLPAYERETVLPNALGNFEQLLVATAKSPAMLEYLDNWESIGPNSAAAQRVKQVQKARPNGELAQRLPKGINENYARELMELHTLGVGGGYTQKDVIEVAKCFTGWTVDRNYQYGGTDEFVFMANRHEGGDKVVLGHTIKEDGMNEGLEVLHILATSPATAKFVSTKLAVRFVSDTPPAALVDRMAATFLKTNGDIKAVLTTMFHAPEFWSPEVYRAKVKTPVEFLVSALRASDAQVKNALPLVQAMERLGMPVYGMQTPNGYSWMSDQWVSSNALVSRMNFALVLSGNRVPGTMIDWPSVLGGSVDAAAPTAGTERELEGLILGVGQTANARTRETVLAQFNNPTALTQAEQGFAATKVADDEDNAGGGFMRTKARKEPMYGQRPVTPLDTMAGLLLGSPDFQRR